MLRQNGYAASPIELAAMPLGLIGHEAWWGHSRKLQVSADPLRPPRGQATMLRPLPAKDVRAYSKGRKIFRRSLYSSTTRLRGPNTVPMLPG
jgi:hypothetical protein